MVEERIAGKLKLKLWRGAMKFWAVEPVELNGGMMFLE